MTIATSLDEIDTVSFKDAKDIKDRVFLGNLEDWLNCPAPVTSEAWIQDRKCPLLALRVRRSGARSFYEFIDSAKPVYPDDVKQNARRAYLGDVGDYTVQQARTLVQLKQTEIVVERPRPRLRRGLAISVLFETFEREYPSAASDWCLRRNNLLAEHLMPKLGARVVSGVTKSEWTNFVQSVTLSHPSQGVHLKKSLSFFLWWGVKRGALCANPLARTTILVPSRKAPRALSQKDIAAIYAGSQALESPWRELFGIGFLTGEPMEYVRRIRRADIELGPRVWRIDSGRFNGLRHVHLTDPVMTLLDTLLHNRDWLFPSQRLSNEPISIPAEVVCELKSLSSVEGKWTLRDCRRAIKRYLGSSRPARVRLVEWAKHIEDTLNVDDAVML